MSENVTARIPAKKRKGATVSGTANEYANIGNEARNSAMAAMAGSFLMVLSFCQVLPENGAHCAPCAEAALALP